MTTIDDPDDPRLDDYRHLTDAAARRAVESSGAAHGILVVEGLVALEQLLNSTLVIRSVLTTPSRAKALSPLPADVPRLVATRGVLSEVCGYDVHRGVLASAARPEPADSRRLISAARRAVVLEGVTDNENIGSLFRNAAAFGMDAVLLDRTCADPYYRRSIRVSSGWAMRIPHARVPGARDALEVLHERGFRTVALTPNRGAAPVDVATEAGNLDDPVAYVVGAEGTGLTQETIDACSCAVRIPMSAGVDSLNVATSLGVIAAFAAARRGWT